MSNIPYNYYNASKIVIFPSSNAIDKGKVTAEDNIRGIVNRLKIRNHTRTDSDFELSGKNSTTLNVSSGQANIYGYAIDTTESKSISIPDIKKSAGTYQVALEIHLDTNNNILGNDTIYGDTENGAYPYNEGVTIELVSTSTEISEYMLLLGTITINSAGKITNIVPNENKVFTIDAGDIFVSIDNDYINENQDISLDEFINSYLPEHYIFRYKDDTKVGNLKLIGDTDSSEYILIDPDTNSQIVICSKNNSGKYTTSSIRYENDILKIEGNGSQSCSFIASDRITNKSDTIINMSQNDSDGYYYNDELTNTGWNFKYHNKSFMTIDKDSLSLSDIIASISSTRAGEYINLNDTGSIINGLKITNCLVSDSYYSILSGPTLSTVGGSSIHISNSVSVKKNLSVDKIANVGALYSDSIISNRSEASDKDYLEIDNTDITFSNSNNNKISSISFYKDNMKNPSTGEDRSSVDVMLYHDYSDSNNRLYLDGNLYIKSGISNGNIIADGTITADKVYNAVYNDYAEWYLRDDIDNDTEPGDVICVRESGKFGKCTEKESTRVVGVHSDTYGHIVGGDQLDNMEDNIKKYIPVGISGRVKVKCDCITKPGDLLVSSDIPGYATVCNNPKAGSVIGKALSDNVSGYVNMQIMLR